MGHVKEITTLCHISQFRERELVCQCVTQIFNQENYYTLVGVTFNSTSLYNLFSVYGLFGVINQ